MNEQLKIVVVDDDQITLTLVQGILEEHHMDVVTFLNVEDTLAFIQNDEWVDVIISDINMPHASGYELCQKLSTIKTTKHIPVLLISASTDTETMLKSYDSGCFDFIQKPIEPIELMTKVKSAGVLRREFMKINSKINKTKSTAFEAMENCSKMQTIIDLADSSRQLLTLSDLASKTFETLEHTGIKASFLFVHKDELNFFSPDGSAKPLEFKLMEALMSSDKFDTSNRFVEMNGRLFTKYDSFIGIIKNPSHDGKDHKDYIAAILNFVDSQAQLIFHEQTREEEKKADRENVITKFEESIVELKGIFSSQMCTINGIVDLIMSEISVKFSSLDICDRTEQIIGETIKESLGQVEHSIERGGDIFENTIEELLEDLHHILLAPNIDTQSVFKKQA